MKILIVGSKGFIGSYLHKVLSDSGSHEVWGSDVINDYESKNYLVIDAGNSDFEEIFQTNKFDICINCSGSASVPDSLLHPLRDFYLNTVNTFNILESIRRHSAPCRFMNISSAAVYGNPASLPIGELTETKPLSPYGYHKLLAENICDEFYRFYNIHTCSIRIFSAYGNGLKKQIFWDIAQRSKAKNYLLLFGTGKESRDFIHIHDIINAISLIILKGEFNGTIYNVGNNIEINIKSAAQMLLDLLGWKGSLEFNGQQRAGDPLNWQADISKIVGLGYQQEVNMDSGLLKYAEWLREEKLV